LQQLVLTTLGLLTSPGQTLCSMSASRNFVPGFCIFPRRGISLLLMKDGPSDAAYHISKNERSNEELFVVWLKHFTKFVKPSKEDSDILTRTLLKEQLLEKKEKHEKNKNKKLLKNDFKPKTVVEVKKR
jgi:hypothetical protein